MNPIVRIVINIIDGFVITLYAIVFARVKFNYKKVVLSSILFGLIMVFTFYIFIENSYKNTLLIFCAIFPWIVIFTFVFGLLFKASFSKSLIGILVYYAAETVGEMIVTTLAHWIVGQDVIKNLGNNIQLQIVGSIGVYPIELIVLIVSKKLLLTKNIDTIMNKKYELKIIAFGICNISITMIEVAIFTASKLSITEMVLITANSIFFLIMNVVFLFIMKWFIRRDQELEYQKLYNKSLGDIVNQLSVFKHNFDNIIASISGYIQFGKWEGLMDFVNGIKKKQTTMGLHNISMLKNIKEPGIIGLILGKLDMMRENGVYCSIIIDNEININGMKIEDLCECLGILIDNALEAVRLMDNGFVKITIKQIEKSLTFIIENSVTDVIELNMIFEKGWSTKGENRGLGLWYAMSIIKSYNNVFLNTTLKNNIISQELIINI